MSNSWQNRKTSNALHIRRGSGFAALMLFASTLTGCSTTTATAPKSHDPLNGIMSPPGMPVPNAPQTAMGPSDSLPMGGYQGGGYQGGYQGGVPAVPTSFAPTNTATLATMSGQGPLGRPLAIDDDGKPRPVGDWTRPGQTLQTPVSPGYIGATNNPRVEAVPDVSGKAFIAPVGTWQSQSSVAPLVQTADNTQLPSANQVLDEQLKARGVLNPKVEQVPEGVHLTCYVSRGPAGGFRVLEATAVDYPAAAQAILQQLAQATPSPAP